MYCRMCVNPNRFILLFPYTTFFKNRKDWQLPWSFHISKDTMAEKDRTRKGSESLPGEDEVSSFSG